MPQVAERVSFDVLVVGSGASGLAAALSGERAGARTALVSKGSLQSCNSAKAQGGIQAAFGADDSPEHHAEDVWQSSHETANRALVEVLTGEAPAAIHWLEGQGGPVTRADRGSRACSSRARTAATGGPAAAARAGSGCSRSATARATRSRRRCATRTPPRAAKPSRTRRRPHSSNARTAGAGRAAAPAARRPG